MIKWNYCPNCAKQLITGKEGHPSCPDGHFTKYPNPVPGAVAAIRHNNEYLITKRTRDPNKGEWVFPGGFIEYEESAEESLLREIEEETGLKNIRIKEYLGSFVNHYGDIAIGIVMGYLDESEDRNVTLNEENSEYRWLPLDQIPHLAFEDCRAALEVLYERENLNS